MKKELSEIIRKMREGEQLHFIGADNAYVSCPPGHEIKWSNVSELEKSALIKRDEKVWMGYYELTYKGKSIAI